MLSLSARALFEGVVSRAAVSRNRLLQSGRMCRKTDKQTDRQTARAHGARRGMIQAALSTRDADAMDHEGRPASTPDVRKRETRMLGRNSPRATRACRTCLHRAIRFALCASALRRLVCRARWEGLWTLYFCPPKTLPFAKTSVLLLCYQTSWRE